MAMVKTTDTPSVCDKKSVEWWWWYLGPIYTANEKKMSLTIDLDDIATRVQTIRPGKTRQLCVPDRKATKQGVQGWWLDLAEIYTKHQSHSFGMFYMIMCGMYRVWDMSCVGCIVCE
jgi:hypothetical protein